MQWASSRWKGTIFVLPAFLYLVVTCLYPLVYSLRLSFLREEADRSVFVGMQNYFRVLSDSVTWLALRNSLFFTSFTVLFHFLMGLLFALLLRKIRRGRNVWRALQFIPWLFPPVIAACIGILIYQPQYGLINSILFRLDLGELAHDWLGDPKLSLAMITIVNIWNWYPFFSLMLLAGMESIPPTLYEAARIDGADQWGRFFHITLPLLLPVIITCVLLDGVWTFRFFDLVWIMTKGGPMRVTEIMPTWVYKAAFYEFDFNLGAALGGVMFLFSLAFAVAYMRFYYRTRRGV